MKTKDILYELRTKKGLSQDELAEKVYEILRHALIFVSVDPGTVQKWCVFYLGSGSDLLSRAFSTGFIATRETRIVVQALLAVSHAPPCQLRPQDALGSGATDAARAEPSQVLVAR